MELIDLTPTAMAAGGDAIARAADGRVVFVSGALPGELVRARVVSSKKDYARAEVVDVVSASPDRVDGHGADGGCGCTWSHVSRSAQGGLKVAIVEDALRRIGRLPEVAVQLRPQDAGSDAVPLRTTVRLGIDEGSGRAGHRRRRSHEVVADGLVACEALHPLLRELVSSSQFPGADEVVLRVGVASGERAALAVPAPAPSSASFVVPAGVALGPGSVVHESVADAWLQVSIESFFQSGPAAATSLVLAVDEAIGDALPPEGHLVDAYAGVGLFGAAIESGRVTAIESDPSAVADARVNLADVDAVVVQGEVGAWRPPAGERIDVVVADPARSGLGRPGVGSVDRSGAGRLVLVSCDPASLARDARLLVDLGWTCDDVVLVDAFPDTFHVEAVTGFTRGE